MKFTENSFCSLKDNLGIKLYDIKLMVLLF